MAKTVRMFNSEIDLLLTDLPNLRFLDYDEEGVGVRANTTEVKGRDGLLVGSNSFSEFNLVLRFFHSGVDTHDYNLMKQKLRGLLFRRDPFYIVHSGQPGKRYAVYCNENSITDIGDRYGTFEITFVVYKGFSESYKSTAELDLIHSDDWQFEEGLIVDRDIKYVHNTKRFEIWNGSDDVINPLFHKLNIKITGTAPNGFKMTNHMTGETFQYTGTLSAGQTLELIGVHPVKNNTRVGVDTNWEWITLQRGFNNIEIEGNGLIIEKVEWDFNFIFR